MRKLSDKQEKFIQAIVSGMKQADAYRHAYDTKRMKNETIQNNAYMLMKNSEVTARIAILAAKVEEKVIKQIAIDKAWVISKLVKIVDLGMALDAVIADDGSTGEIKIGNLSAANKALELIGKEQGMFVDRKDIKVTHMSELDDTDLDNLIAQKAREAGVTLQ